MIFLKSKEKKLCPEKSFNFLDLPLIGKSSWWAHICMRIRELGRDHTILSFLTSLRATGIIPMLLDKVRDLIMSLEECQTFRDPLIIIYQEILQLWMTLLLKSNGLLIFRLLVTLKKDLPSLKKLAWSHKMSPVLVNIDPKTIGLQALSVRLMVEWVPWCLLNLQKVGDALLKELENLLNSLHLSLQHCERLTKSWAQLKDLSDHQSANMMLIKVSLTSLSKAELQTISY